MWLNGPSQIADGLPLELLRGDYVFGRDKDCQVVIRDMSVSRRHARIAPLSSATAEIEDLKSRNGTFVNEVRVTRATIQLGDRLILGAVEFVVAKSPLSMKPDEGVSTARVRRDPDSLALATRILTPTQYKVFLFLLDGLDEKQAARRCGCSPHTIHNHIQAIYKAFGVHSRQQLLARFVGATPFPDVAQ
jgi:pSer/pThr/pTyr-binding forkhead associated (FHA) protein